jgi:PAS domain S-box-containing protein
MGKHSFEDRISTIIDAIAKASRGDASTAIPRTGRGDALDRLVDAIEDILRRSRESLAAFQSAQETVQRLQFAGERKAESELSREQLFLMDSLKESIPDKIYFKDKEGRFINLSKAYAKEFDLMSERDAVGKTDFDFFTVEHARSAFEDEQKIILTGEPIINKEEKETRPDRPATWALTTKMPLRDRDGAIVGTFGISRDITDRKRAEEGLERERALLSTLIDNLPDYIAVKDTESRILITNTANARVMGLEKPRDAVGKTDLDFYPPAEAERYLADERAVIRTGEALINKEEESFDQGGRTRWTLTTKVPLQNAQGEVVGVVCTGRDITDWKQAEELLRASLAEKEMLLREVHHRVKNNLQVISSLVALQESSFRDEADRTLGRDMQARIGSMARLHELLYGSKDLSGIDTAEYLEAIVGEISAYYGNALVRVEAESDILSIDEAMPFGLIATELLTNALKYAYPSGGAGEILVSYGRFGPERRLEIRDEGVGLPPEIDPAKSPSLGFTLVRSLAEQIGGRISIDAAKPGESFSGLRVFLAFPARAPARDAAP